MIRNFVTGIVVGGVVAGVGLGIISQLSPMPQVVQGQSPDVTAAAVPTPAAEADAQADATIAAPVAVDAGATAASESSDATVLVPNPTPTGTDKTGADKAAPAVSAEPPKPDASAEPPADVLAGDVSTPAPKVNATADPAPKTPPVVPLPQTAEAEASPAAADLPPPAPPEPAEALLTPPPAVAAQPNPAEVALDPAPEPVPQETPDPALPKVLEPGKSATLAPNDGLTKTVDGVTTGRLPTIGDAAAPAEIEAPAAVADDRPISRFARAFSNDAGKPLFAVLLLDSGAADVDREKLAALPFPISFVVNPMDPGAAAAAAIYRKAGQEVVMLATGIPQGATPGDLEQTFQANAAVLPEAVAVMDLATAGFQDDRPLATMVVPLIKEQGRGLVTFDAGLNAADQVARRDDVPAAVVFRTLDSEGEETPLIRRYLDRAAFKAAQEGRVVVLGTTRAETIAALMEWTVEGRASSVALAPVSAVLSVK